ncbi:MAG: potassium channel family protein [Cyanobacteriota bacterium]
MDDRFLKQLLWLSLLVLVSTASPPSLARLTWLGYPLLSGQLLLGLSARPPWRTPWGKRTYQAIGLASIVAQVIWVFSPRSLISTSLPLLILFLFFMGWSLVRLLHRIAWESPSESALVAGGLAGYLLLGISGGLLLTVIDSLVPGCFRDSATGAMVQLPPLGSDLAATATWDVNVQRIIYFAFVSLTTVGYGDISPVQPVAQLASVSLSVLGPLYIAVVIGVVVSRLVAQTSRTPQDGEHGSS